MINYDSKPQFLVVLHRPGRASRFGIVILLVVSIWLIIDVDGAFRRFLEII